MKVSELIEALSRYDRDDDVTFYYLKNNTLTNCQFEDLGFYGDMGVEFTIQDTYDGIETTMFLGGIMNTSDAREQRANEEIDLQLEYERVTKQRYEDFQEWLNKCPLVITDYQDFTNQFQITFNLEAD